MKKRRHPGGFVVHVGVNEKHKTGYLCAPLSQLFSLRFNQ